MLILQPYLASYRIDFYNELSKIFDIHVLYWFLKSPDHNFNQDLLIKKISYKFSYLRIGFKIKLKDGIRVFKIDILYHLVKYRPNIVIVHEFGFFTLICIFLKKIFKFSIFINCDDSFDIALKNNSFKRSLKFFCIKHTDGLIVSDKRVLDYYKTCFNAYDKIIDNPIMHNDIKFRSNLEKSIPITKKIISEYKLNGSKNILFVGRLSKVKGIDLLLEAFKIVNYLNKECKLFIVGEGEESKKILEYIKMNMLEDAAFLVGKQEDLNLMSWYNLGQIFVLPSRYEPFGAVVNEALIAGNDVLCSDVAGASVLIVEGFNGLLFKSNSITDLTEKIKLQLEKISPILDSAVSLKTNLMPFSFKQNFEKVVNFITEKIN